MGVGARLPQRVTHGRHITGRVQQQLAGRCPFVAGHVQAGQETGLATGQQRQSRHHPIPIPVPNGHGPEPTRVGEHVHPCLDQSRTGCTWVTSERIQRSSQFSAWARSSASDVTWQIRYRHISDNHGSSPESHGHPSRPRARKPGRLRPPPAYSAYPIDAVRSACSVTLRARPAATGSRTSAGAKNYRSRGRSLTSGLDRE